MNLHVSQKHQVVIPKEVRKVMRLPSTGAYMSVKSFTANEVTFQKVASNPAEAAGIMRFAGIAKGAWGADPVATLRAERNNEWDD